MQEIVKDLVDEQRYARTIALLKRIVTTESTVVEIGATDASFQAACPCNSWVTVDKFGNPDVIVDVNGPAVALPFDSNSVDVVVCTEVLEHLTMGGPLVKELARILRRDGVAVVSVPNIVSLRSRALVILGRLPSMAASGDCGPPLGGSGIDKDGHWVAGHVVDFNKERLVAYLLRGGLRVTKFHKVPFSLRIKRVPILDSIIVPDWLYPTTFSEFILVEASPCDSQE